MFSSTQDSCCSVAVLRKCKRAKAKTLAALLPAYLFSLIGKGCHVVTANDYLAKRDAEFASAVFKRLGVSVGCLFENLERNKRKAEYDRNITYGTAREFGFDFLKDRLAENLADGGSDAVQRGHFFALVDEADSVLIDDARTPLLIAKPADADEARQELVRACHEVSLKIKNQIDYQLIPNQRVAQLTKAGCLSVLKRCHSRLVLSAGTSTIYEQVEKSLCANFLFDANRHYVVNNEGDVAIVDESTGRIADGRKWQNGLHQAVEVKEGVTITGGTQTLAKVTVQTYFRNYHSLAGLTGTAQQVTRELKKTYDLKVITVPTRRPSNRLAIRERIFRTYAEKSKAIAETTRRRIDAGQAVLIGTPSVESSQKISQTLNENGIEHHVLNCLEHERESGVIQAAGRAGRVTVATNMAGRGTDIHIEESVLTNGGLHIIATARHSSSRIDRQLIGRTARQGHPGSYQFFLSLEDESFLAAGQGTQKSRLVKSTFDRVQSKIERQHEQQRIALLEHEKHRNKLCLQMGLDPCLEMLDE